MPGKTKSGPTRRKRLPDETKAFDDALRRAQTGHFVLKLYVTGSTPHSVLAIRNIKRICEERLKGRYRLEIIDLYQEPWRARQDELAVAPTLVKKLPLPLRTLVGDLSKTERVLAGLDLQPRIADPPAQKSSKEK